MMLDWKESPLGWQASVPQGACMLRARVKDGNLDARDDLGNLPPSKTYGSDEEAMLAFEQWVERLQKAFRCL